MLPDEFPALTLGHPAPDAELNPVVERIGEALGDDGALTTYQRGSILRRAPSKAPKAIYDMAVAALGN
jgi:hypothetical protein